MHYFTITKINDPRLTKRLKEKERKESKGPLPLSCRYLECVFCFRIKEKEKHTFYIKFYFIIFLKVFFFSFSLLQQNNYNGYVCAIYNCYFLLYTSYDPT